MRTRKKRNGDRRFNALSALLYAGAPRIDGNAEFTPFEREAPLRLELGCGKGGFIRDLSAARPEYNFVAMERITDVIITAMEKYACARGLGEMRNCAFAPLVATDGDGRIRPTPEEAGNVRFLNGDAANLSEYFAQGSLDALYLNFSDPWTKKGYYKRRLTYIDFLVTYAGLLRPGGELRFKTDNRPLFDFSLEQLEGSPFELVACTNDLHASEYNEGNVMTEYERNFSNNNIPINMLAAVRR